MSELFYSDMMSFSGSQSKGSQKMVEKQLDRKKHTSGEAPKVCSVCTITCSQAMLAADAARSPQRDLTRGRSRPAVRGALVDTSVHLKPVELLDVALDVLAGLAPCLNLGVGELGHKDLLDTIGADNCRK